MGGVSGEPSWDQSWKFRNYEMLNAGDGTTEIFTTEKSGEGDSRWVSKRGWSSSCFSGLHRFCRFPDGRQGDDVVGDVYPLHRLQWEMSQESSGKFLLVRALVEQAPKIAVNGEDVCRHAAEDFPKLLLV